MKKSLKLLSICFCLFLLFVGCRTTIYDEPHNKTDTKRTVKVLNDLIQVDIDTYHAYAQAINSVTSKKIRQILLSFRADHERHIKELSAEIVKMDGVPTEFSRDFKGFIISGYTSIRSSVGTKGALNAMESNERLTNNRYLQAIYLELPDSVLSLIKANLADEKHHIKAIREVLSRCK